MPAHACTFVRHQLNRALPRKPQRPQHLLQAAGQLKLNKSARGTWARWLWCALPVLNSKGASMRDSRAASATAPSAWAPCGAQILLKAGKLRSCCALTQQRSKRSQHSQCSCSSARRQRSAVEAQLHRGVHHALQPIARRPHALLNIYDIAHAHALLALPGLAPAQADACIRGRRRAPECVQP